MPPSHLTNKRCVMACACVMMLIHCPCVYILLLVDPTLYPITTEHIELKPAVRILKSKISRFCEFSSKIEHKSQWLLTSKGNPCVQRHDQITDHRWQWVSRTWPRLSSQHSCRGCHQHRMSHSDWSCTLLEKTLLLLSFHSSVGCNIARLGDQNMAEDCAVLNLVRILQAHFTHPDVVTGV